MTEAETEIKQLVDAFLRDIEAVARKHLVKMISDTFAAHPASRGGRVAGPSPAQAQAQAHAPKPAPRRPVRAASDLGAVAPRILGLLRENTQRPASGKQIAAALGLPPELVKAGLKALVDTREVRRRGAGRGTCYELAEREIESLGAFARASEMVIDDRGTLVGSAAEGRRGSIKEDVRPA